MECSSCVSDFLSAFSSRKFSQLRKIHSEIINEFIKNPKPVLLKLAILSYVLSKLLSKHRFSYINGKEFGKIESLLVSLSDKQISSKEFEEKLNQLEDVITALEEKDPRYIYNMFTKAKIKVAAKLYAKGMSLGKVSKLTEIPKEEILSYAGKTLMFDRVRDEKSMKDRVALLKRMIE